MNLQNWVNQAREHWKEFQPKRYGALVKSGKLEAALQDAAERTCQEMSQLEDMGYKHQEAWEIVRESYLFPPAETSNYRRSDSPLWKPAGQSLPDMMHAAIKSGAREVELPRAGTFTAADLKKALKGE